MKNINKRYVLRGVIRIALNFILGSCISILFIFLLLGDDELFKMLFSFEKNTEIILLFSLTWFFGTILGAIIASMEFINLLAKKNVQLEEKKLEINKLKQKLNRFSKKSSSSFADRMFSEIENLTEVSKTGSNSPDKDFKTLQELNAIQHDSKQQQ